MTTWQAVVLVIGELTKVAVLAVYLALNRRVKRIARRIRAETPPAGTPVVKGQ